MIGLPRLTITRSEYREVQISDKIRTWIETENEKRGDGIHASDLLDPRQAYWNKVSPKTPTEREVFFFAIGKVLHAILLQAWEPTHDEFATDSGTTLAEGILFSPDLKRPDGAPIELKSNRSMREPDPDKLQDELSSYLEQLSIYMVLQESREGELWILYLNMLDKTRRSHPTIRCYTITIAEAQYELLRGEVFGARDLLSDALLRKDPSQLVPCRSWKCGEGTCQHWKRCKPEGRYGKLTKRAWTS